MADRFPLIVNSTDQQIQELVSGDNLDLTGSGIVADVFTVDTNSSERLRIDASGNMGLGTNNPAQQSGIGLHIHNASGQSRLKLSNGTTGSTANDGFDFIVESSNDVHILNHENGVFKFGTNDQEAMRINSARQLLLGTGTEGHESADDFTIATGSHAGMTIRSGNTSQGSIYFSDATSGAGEYAGWLRYDHSANNMTIGTNSTEAIKIDNQQNFGIGGIAPNAKLHVKLDTNKHLYFQGNIGEIGSVPGIQGVTDAGSLASLGLRGSTLRFATGSAERVRIDSSGQVGIGTASPSTLLHLSGSADTYLTLEAGTTDGNDGILFKNSAGTQKGALLYDTDDNYLLFNVNESERMRIDSAGRMGLGTLSPSVLLHVKESTGAHANLILENSEGSAKLGTNSNVFYVESSQHIFYNSGGSTEYARLDSSGRLLINHTTNTAGGGYDSKLQLCDTSYQGASISIRRDGNSTGGGAVVFAKSRSTSKGGSTAVLNGDNLGNITFYGADGSDANTSAATIRAEVDGTPGSNDMPGRLVFATTADGASSSTERLRIDNSGNVGINRTNPDQRLNVSGNIELNAYDDTSGNGGYNTSSGLIIGNAYDAGKSAGDDRNSIIWLERGLDLVFATTDTERLRIDSAGNMGLGTTSPQKKLHVSDTTGPAQIRITGSSGSSDIYADANIYFQPNGTTRVTMDSSGRLLVGTTTPGDAAADNLTIHSSGDTGITIRASETDSSSIYFADGTGGTNVYTGAIIYDHATNHMSLHTNSGAERMRIDSSGNVGIGQTSMPHKLCVNGNIQLGSASQLRSSSSSGELRIQGGSTFPGGNILLGGGNADDNIVFNTTGASATSTERMRIDSSGNINVGSSTVSGTGVHLRPFGNVISRRASGALQVFEGYQGSTLTSEIKADGSATFAGGYGSSGVSITSDGEVRADSQVTSNRSSGVCFSAQQGGTQKASISADGSASLASGNLTVDAGGQIAAYASVGTQGYFKIRNTANNGWATILYGDGSALFGNGNFIISSGGTILADNGGNPAGSAKININSNGNATFGGAVSKGSGSFRIDHPLKPETHQLVHSFVEGPQADNIYRGKVELVDGAATVNIDTVAGMTEGTFAALNREIQCFTTNETGWTAIKGSVTGNLLTIVAQDNTCTDTISWLVIGERKDQHMYDTEWTDENGKVIVEPEKEVGTESETE